MKNFEKYLNLKINTIYDLITHVGIKKMIFVLNLYLTIICCTSAFK